MREYLKVESLIDGKVMKFKPHNGGWGIGFFETYPSLPKCRPSGDCHTVYTLGTPDVIWWAGHEHGRDGYGLAIRTADGCWKSWYNCSSFGMATWLEISCEQLSQACIEGVFKVRVGKDGIDVFLISITVAKRKGKADDLVPPGVEPNVMNGEEKGILRKLLRLLGI